MDSKRNISITEPTTANALDDLFGFEAARKRQEDRDLTTENMKPHFKPWRVFINHIDSYHGKILTDVCTDFNNKNIKKSNIYIFIYFLFKFTLDKRFKQKFKHDIIFFCVYSFLSYQFYFHQTPLM